MRRIKPKGPKALYEVEASHVWASALPGVVMLQLKRDIDQERRAGHATQRMFVELTISEAMEHHRKLGEIIAQAGAMGSTTPGGDSAPLL